MTSISRRRVRAVLTAALVLIGGALVPTAPADEKPALDLARERLAILAEMERLQEVAAKAGQKLSPSDEVGIEYLWSRRRMEAERDVSGNMEAERDVSGKKTSPAAAVQAHLERMKRLEERVAQRVAYVGIAADPRTRLVPVLIRVDEPRERLSARMDVKVRLGIERPRGPKE